MQATIAAVTSARTMQGLQNASFHFEALVPGSGTEMCEIVEEAWPEVVWDLTSVTVVVDECEPLLSRFFRPLQAFLNTVNVHSTFGARILPVQTVPATPKNYGKLYVKTQTGKTIVIECIFR